MHRISQLLVSLMLSFLATLFTGCTTRGLADKLAEFEKLGITEAQITGKFSNTTYTVEKKNGTRTAVLDHSNAWMPKIKLVRETALPIAIEAPEDFVGPVPPPGLIVPPATPLSPTSGDLRRD